MRVLLWYLSYQFNSFPYKNDYDIELGLTIIYSCIH